MHMSSSEFHTSTTSCAVLLLYILYGNDAKLTGRSTFELYTTSISGWTVRGRTEDMRDRIATIYRLEWHNRTNYYACRYEPCLA